MCSVCVFASFNSSLVILSIVLLFLYSKINLYCWSHKIMSGTIRCQKFATMPKIVVKLQPLQLIFCYFFMLKNNMVEAILEILRLKIS